MAINLITGYEIAPPPLAHKNWGNAISYDIAKFQNGNNLALPDNQNHSQ